LKTIEHLVLYTTPKVRLKTLHCYLSFSKTMIVVVAIGISMYVNQWISYRIEYYTFTCLPQIQRHNKKIPTLLLPLANLS